MIENHAGERRNREWLWPFFCDSRVHLVDHGNQGDYHDESSSFWGNLGDSLRKIKFKRLYDN